MKNTNQRKFNLLTLIFALALLLPASTFAVNWIGGTGDWNVGANWSSGSIPISTEVVNINSGICTIPAGYDADCFKLQMTTSGELIIAATGTLTAHATDGQNRAVYLASTSKFTNNGTFTSQITKNDHILIAGDAELINNGTISSLTATSQSGINLEGNGALTNNGDIFVNDQFRAVTATASIVNNGNIECTILYGDQLSNNANGNLLVKQSISGGVPAAFLGAVSPGAPTLGTQIAILQSTSLDYGSTTLNIELAGTSGAGSATGNDQLKILSSGDGTITLGGTTALNVTTIDGFSASNGDEFVIVNGGSITGTFATTNFPTTGWEVSYDEPSTGDITLKAVNVPNIQIPTMEEWSLIIFGLIILSFATVYVMRWNKTMSFE